MQNLLFNIAALGPAIAIVLTLLAGGSALLWLRGRSGTGDELPRRVFRTATVLAVISGLAVGFLSATFGGMFSGGIRVEVVLTSAVGAAILVWLASIAGGAVALARGSAAMLTVAAVLGPVVLLGGPYVARSGLELVANGLASSQEGSAIEERSKVLLVSHGAPEVGIYADNSGRLSLARMQVTVLSSVDIELAQDPASAAPGFAIAPIGKPELRLLSAAPQGGPTNLRAGESTTYDLSWTTIGGDVSVQAGGRWELTVEFLGNGGQQYRVVVPFDMPS